MELRVLGVGDAFTSIYYNTSFLVLSRRPFLVDTPQGLFRLLRERGIDRATINDVIITHIHGDHCSGLQTLMLWKRYVEGRPLRLYTSRSVYRLLQERVFPAFADTFTPDLEKIVASRFDEYADFVELSDDGPFRLDEDLQVEIRENWHPTPTLGLKMISPGGSVAISGDTCYRPALLRRLLENGTLDAARYEKLAGGWLWDADVIYHEVARSGPSPHTLESDLLLLPEETGRKIRLVHVADDFTEDRLKVAREGEAVQF